MINTLSFRTKRAFNPMESIEDASQIEASASSLNLPEVSILFEKVLWTDFFVIIHWSKLWCSRYDLYFSSPVHRRVPAFMTLTMRNMRQCLWKWDCCHGNWGSFAVRSAESSLHRLSDDGCVKVWRWSWGTADKTGKHTSYTKKRSQMNFELS